MHPVFDLYRIVILFYVTARPLFKQVVSALDTSGTSKTFRVVAFVHNSLLCLYSTWTAVNVVPLTYKFFQAFGADNVYCEHDLWEAGLGYWGFLFYLSKSWELVDTALLIIKRREPSFLQVYHHAMTILCAYWLQASHASVMFLFVGLNATIHSIMYFYYALTTLGVRSKAKSLITSAQITQFVAGIVCATPIFYFRNGACANIAQKFAVAAVILHAMYLIKLFAQFYKQSYSKKGKNPVAYHSSVKVA